MARSRRAALRLGATAVATSLSGCAGMLDREASGAEGTATAESATDGTTTDGSTAADGSTADDPTTHELAVDASFPEGSTEFPDGPKSRPERPDDLTGERVREYVRTFERRLVYNRLHRDETTEVTAECEVESVTEYDLGYRVVVRCTASANDERDGVTYHADYFARYATYYVGSDSTVRREGEPR